MCDQTELSYSDGDVVWVKIGPIWWPGVVKDISKEGKEEELFGGLKNKPIATVQFFEEDKYEFVKNLENIYHYNCRRKDEFIRKGLDKFRSGAKHMVKFPADVGKAEELIKGDVNIVNDAKFAPIEKKNNNDFFAPTSTKKKIRKTEDLTIKSKYLPLKKRLSAPAHRQVSATLTLSTSGPSDLSCPLCEFSANLIDTMSSHFLYFHSSKRANFGGDDSITTIRRPIEPKRARSTPGTSKKRGRSAKPKIETPRGVTNDTPAKSAPVKRTAPNSVTAEKPVDKKKRFTDALLADWSEDEDNKEEANIVPDSNENMSVSDPVETEKEEPKPEIAETAGDVDKDDEGEINHNSSDPSAEGSNDNDRRETSSCFDFDDEDDGFIGMSDAYTYGRKIPRVIPVKDKTDLGRDLEVDEVFKKKPDSESADDEDNVNEVVSEPVKKRRGRPPSKQALSKDSNGNVKTPKKPEVVKKAILPKTVNELKTGLAATRQRRSGARKSYLKEVIEKIDDDEEEEESEQLLTEENEYECEEFEVEEPPKPSRRKQDLKSQKLMEYDDVESLVLAKKMREKGQLEQKKKIIMKEMEDIETKNVSLEGDKGYYRSSPEAKVTKKEDNNDDDLTAQVESLLAETSPTVFTKTPSYNVCKPQASHEELAEEIEYLEDDPPPPVMVTPVKQVIPPISPIKKLKTLELEQAVKKSVIPQWKQGIQESLKLNKEMLAKEAIAKPEPAKPNVIKLSSHRLLQSQQKSPRYLILSPQQGIVSNSSNAAHRIKLTNLPRTSASSVVQIDPTRKKVIKLSTSAVQQKQLKSGDGIQMIKNFNGTGKTAVILKEISGSGMGRKIMVTPEKRCFIQRKGPDGNITLQSIVNPKRSQQIVFNNQTVKFVPKPEAVVEPPIVEPVVEHVAAETVTNLAGGQQVVLPPTGDAQTTYMLVTVDGQTVLQAVDSSLLPFNVQPEVSTQLYDAPSEVMKPVFSSPAQDILAEALANTNVLESEMPLMMPSVVQETCVTMQKPIMTPMEMPTNVLPDPTLLIAPVVQETSVTLQKPIMTPVEVPTSIVADTSGFEPPPLPPTPTEEDVMMDENEDSLMIADQPQQQQQAESQVSDEIQNQGHFFIDDSQEGEEVNSFQSMPLLNEESTASEDHIGNQNFDAQGGSLENSEYLPSSTNADLEAEPSEPTEQEIPPDSYNAAETQEPVGIEKDAQSLPFITEEGFVVTGEAHSSLETEVTSTTGDSKDSVV